MERRKTIQGAAVVLLLAGLAFWAFGGALDCGFVTFDDGMYVYRNPVVAEGMSWTGVRWAFTTGAQSNWHPLTWLSHMLDVEWHGLDPRGHHATNLLLHAVNIIVLFGVLRRLTSRTGLALCAAALWGVHPLRAESVVWISERKDVLAMFFGLLAVGAYGWRAPNGVSRPSRRQMLLTTVFFAFSLMAKPLWVTLPFLLLLLDAWPLGRRPKERWGRLVVEKWPLFGLTAASCAVTLAVQTAGGAVRPLAQYPLSGRLANAVVALAQYGKALFWPRGLAFFHPMPGAGHGAAAVAGAAVFLVAGTVGCLAVRRKQPWAPMGWLWFAGALVPMLGLVQMGEQAWADRYTYLPHIGLILAVVWTADRMLRSVPPRAVRRVGPLAACAAVVALGVASRRQTKTWQDSGTLYRHALAVTRDNALAHGNLGAWLIDEGRPAEGETHLRRSLAIRPRMNRARLQLAKLCMLKGRRAEGRAEYRRVVEDFPDHLESLNNLAWLLATDAAATAADAAEARRLAERAVRLAPVPAAGLLDTLGAARAAAGDTAGAIEAAEQARELAIQAGFISLAERIGERLRLYRAGHPYRE